MTKMIPDQDGVSDEQLMVAFAAGAAGAFEEIHARYRQAMLGFFYRRVADRAVAEELCQETWLAVVHARSRYKPAATFRTYLYAIALNQLRGYRRKAAFRAVFHGEASLEPGAHSGMDSELMLREAVRKLDPVDREMVMLREFEELSYGEIAELLSLPLNTVRSRLFRARMALRELLAPAVNRREEIV